jgi:hypothetical protein
MNATLYPEDLSQDDFVMVLFNFQDTYKQFLEKVLEF